MAVQAITTSPVALPQILPDQRDPTQQQDDAAQNPARGSPITITRIDKQDYPDGYTVVTTTYANKTSATQSAPRQAPPPLITSAFDPRNGGQLSTLLSAQEGSTGRVAVAGVNPYNR